MAHQYTRSTTTTAELTAEYHGHRDEEVMHALVSAGALVALSDGQLKPVERDELMNLSINRNSYPQSHDTKSPKASMSTFDNSRGDIAQT